MHTETMKRERFPWFDNELRLNSMAFDIERWRDWYLELRAELRKKHHSRKDADLLDLCGYLDRPYNNLRGYYDRLGEKKPFPRSITVYRIAEFFASQGLNANGMMGLLAGGFYVDYAGTLGIAAQRKLSAGSLRALARLAAPRFCLEYDEEGLHGHVIIPDVPSVLRNDKYGLRVSKANRLMFAQSFRDWIQLTNPRPPRPWQPVGKGKRAVRRQLDPEPVAIRNLLHAKNPPTTRDAIRIKAWYRVAAVLFSRGAINEGYEVLRVAAAGNITRELLDRRRP